jgi:hypothetical protein
MEHHCDHCHKQIPADEYIDNIGLCDECLRREESTLDAELDERTAPVSRRPHTWH